MKFGKAFQKDMEEAFEYFKGKQLAAVGDKPEAIAQIQAVELKTWIANILRKPIYELLGEKRANADG